MKDNLKKEKTKEISKEQEQGLESVAEVKEDNKAEDKSSDKKSAEDTNDGSGTTNESNDSKAAGEYDIPFIDPTVYSYKKKRHIKRLREGKCTIEMGFVLSDLVTNFERVSDHCSNIAVCILQIHENVFDTHEYMDIMKAKDNVAFKEEVKQYQMLYALPGKKTETEE